MGAAGWLVNVVSVASIIFFDIMFLFRPCPSPSSKKISDRRAISLYHPHDGIENELQHRHSSGHNGRGHHLVVHTGQSEISTESD
jgi:hypothetical protein